MFDRMFDGMFDVVVTMTAMGLQGSSRLRCGRVACACMHACVHVMRALVQRACVGVGVGLRLRVRVHVCGLIHVRTHVRGVAWRGVACRRHTKHSMYMTMTCVHVCGPW